MGPGFRISMPSGSTRGIMRRLGVNLCYTEEILGFQAGAADQCAIHIANCEQFLGIRRLHRAAIEDADSAAFSAETLRELATDEGMHLGDVRRRRRQPG